MQAVNGLAQDNESVFECRGQLDIAVTCRVVCDGLQRDGKRAQRLESIREEQGIFHLLNCCNTWLRCVFVRCSIHLSMEACL